VSFLKRKPEKPVYNIKNRQRVFQPQHGNKEEVFYADSPDVQTYGSQ
jgi:hypothetical protein